MRPPAASPQTLAPRAVVLAPLALALAAATAGCGHSGIRVDGVMHESTEMRPLQNVPGDAYKQLRVVVKPAAGSESGAECGHTQLDGTMESEDVKNTACLPADAPNDAVRIVRQRLRTYGVQVAREGNEPYDYLVEVRVQGVAPRKADLLGAKAAAKLTYTLREGAAKDGFFNGVDMTAAGSAFNAAARECALKDADVTAFAASTTVPMQPEFDMMALASDAVDASLGCVQIARFFRDVHTRFPKAAPPTPSP